MWLQCYPNILFDTINRSGSGVISKKELKLFYTAFIDAGKLNDSSLTAITERSYSTMTSNGDSHLTLHMYKLSFLNFLFGKLLFTVVDNNVSSKLINHVVGRYPNGPGQFMFGTVKTMTSSFPIDYSVLNRWEYRTKTFSSTRYFIQSAPDEREPFSTSKLQVTEHVKIKRKSIVV